MTRECGDSSVEAGRAGCPGAYAFFARYFLMPWQSCLDVGGGLGGGKTILLRRSRSVVAIDKDPRLEAYGIQVGDISCQDPNSFDWVTCVDVIEHIQADEVFLQHLARVARKGVFVATCNLEHHPDRNWPYHVREYSSSGLRLLFEKEMPDARLLHFGADIYGGHIKLGNVNARWEHQIVVAFKAGRTVLSTLMRVRERAMNVMGR
jgi:SAM-dependent methyltransferase